MKTHKARGDFPMLSYLSLSGILSLNNSIGSGFYLANILHEFKAFCQEIQCDMGMPLRELDSEQKQACVHSVATRFRRCQASTRAELPIYKGCLPLHQGWSQNERDVPNNTRGCVCALTKS